MSVSFIGCGADSADATEDGQSADTLDHVEQAPTAAVSMSTTKFVKSSIKVKVGTTVTWTNSSALGHTVTSGKDSKPASNPGALFDATVPSGGTFSFTFSKAGAFPYFCRPHEHVGMKGTITVVP